MPSLDTTIAGVAVAIDETVVRVTSARPLTLLSSALVAGGFGSAREIVNMHVDDVSPDSSPAADLAAFAASLGIDEPFVGLMTAAKTQYARLAAESRDCTTVAAVVSMGLSNRACAGVSPPSAYATGTINTIVLVDAHLTPAAMVNAVITATEAKTLALGDVAGALPGGRPGERHLDRRRRRRLHGPRRAPELRRLGDRRGLAHGAHRAPRHGAGSAARSSPATEGSARTGRSDGGPPGRGAAQQAGRRLSGLPTFRRRNGWARRRA